MLMLQMRRGHRDYLEIIFHYQDGSDEGHNIPYFFGYKMGLFSFQNNPKNLDPSYKTDLDIWNYWEG